MNNHRFEDLLGVVERLIVDLFSLYSCGCPVKTISAQAFWFGKGINKEWRPLYLLDMET